MKEDNEQKPPPLSVGLTYNLKKNNSLAAEDTEAEYDSIETITAIREALEQAGYAVELFEADRELPSKIIGREIDIIFNIAEGTHGRGREAQVPAILNFLKIPYSGSDETTLCICLDKGLAKRILASYKIRTPRYQVIDSKNHKINRKLSFPVIIKPNAEGSSKGIDDFALAFDNKQLKTLVDKCLDKYGQPVLVEEFIKGREFTVGILGNEPDITVFRPMEIAYKNKENEYNIYSYSVKKEFKKHIDNICPAHIDDVLERKMMDTARRIYAALQCRDLARIDFMLSPDNQIYFIEINPLPGLAPGYSEFPMIARANGMEYNALIREILDCALERHQISRERESCRRAI